MKHLGILLAVILFALPVRAGAWNCESKGQHLAPEKSNTLTYQPNAISSMSSGDLSVCIGDEMFLSAVSCRVAGGDANGGFDIGQLGAAVRWFDSSNKLVGVMPLPLNGPVDVSLLPSQLFYTAAWSSSPATEFDVSGVEGADHMTVRCTAVLMNTSSSPEKATLVINASYVGKH